MRSTFSGTFGPELEADFRPLYLRLNPLLVIAFALLGTVMLLFTLFPSHVGRLLVGAAAKTPAYMSVWERLEFLAFTALFFVMAFFRNRLWWLWWWPKVKREFGQNFAGTATEEGLQLSDSSVVIPWRTFLWAKLGDKAALLYLTKAYALPIHRSLFRQEADWHEFQRTLRASRLRVSTYQEKA